MGKKERKDEKQGVPPLHYSYIVLVIKSRRKEGEIKGGTHCLCWISNKLQTCPLILKNGLVAKLL